VNERGRAGRAVVWGGVCVAVVLSCVAVWSWSGRVDVAAPRLGESQPANGSLPAASTAPTPRAADAAERHRVASAESVLSQTLRIVDEHGAPVADASVTWSGTTPAVRAPRDDVEVEFAERPRLHTGKDGTVTLPGASMQRFVLARKDSAFGCGVVTFDRFEPVPDLVIAEDHNLRVRVVGPDGAPRAGVPVVVRWTTHESPWQDSDDSEAMESDEQGLVTVWHAQTLAFWNREVPVVELSARVFGAASTTVSVSLREPVPAEILAPCAAHGRLRLRPRLPDGSPCRWKFDWDVGPSDGLLDEGARSFARHVGDGELLVPAVALGRAWAAQVTGFDRETFRGPVRDGEEVGIELALAGDTLLAVVHLRWADGTPVVRRDVALDWRWWQTARSDGDGRLVFRVKDGADQVRFETMQPAAAVSVPLPTGAVPGRMLELGEVRLQPAERPLLVAGRVVDAVSGAGLSAGLEIRGVGDLVDREPTELDGSFELFDARFGARVRLTAHRADCVPVSVSVPRGTRDVRIELSRLPQLRATVLLDEQVQTRTLDCEVRRGDDWTAPFQEDERPGRLQCTFVLPAGDPAPDLAFRVWGSVGLPPSWSVPSSEWRPVDAGYATTLDLRGQLANVIVRPSVDGVAVRLDQLFVRPIAEPGAWTDIANGIAHGCVARRDATFDAIAVGDAGFPVRARLVPGESLLELPPPATIAVRLAGWPAGVRGAVQLVRLTWDEPLLTELGHAGARSHDLEPKPMPGSIDDWTARRNLADEWASLGDGAATFAIVARGRVLVVPWAGGGGRLVPLLDAAEALDVTTPGQRIEVPIRLDPAQVEAALR
jgi:hypothetical protein